MVLNPKYLKTFVSLVTTGNFTRAAEILNMTQPGVSQHVKKLENTCQCELVIRLGKGIQLTEQGRRVYEYAQALSDEQTLFLEALKFDEPFEGKCTVSCSGAIAQRIYPVLLGLQAAHEKLHIVLEVSPQHAIISGVENGDIGLGIVTSEPDKDVCKSYFLGQEVLSLFLPNQHIDLDDAAASIGKLGLISHPDAEHYMNLYLKHCGDASLSSLAFSGIKQTGYVNQLSQILLPVSYGMGFTVLPNSVLRYFEHAQGVVAHQAPKTVTEPLYRIHSKHKSLPKRYDCLIKAISAALR